MEKIFCLVGGALAIGVLLMMLLMMATSCTYSINMVHTKGHAMDVIKESDCVDPKIDPTLNIP